MNSKTQKTALQLANKAFQEERFNDAIYLYQIASNDNQKLKHIAEQNIKKSKIALEKKLTPKEKINHKSNSEDQKEKAVPKEENDKSAANKLTTPNLKTAVIFHVYHENIVEETLTYLKNIEFKFDLFVTTPLAETSAAINTILQSYPSATYRRYNNKGRDVLPFLEVYNEIKAYDLCLKIHTKQGLTNYGDLWRDVSLQSLLKDPNYVSNIVNEFKNNSDVLIAGPKDFYLSGRRLIHGNHRNLTSLCNLIGLKYLEDKEWAFFAGTMFWFRPELYKEHVETLKKQDFGKESGKQDGGIEHAIERLFGLIPSYKHGRALLLNGYDDKASIELTLLPMNVGSDDPTKHLAAISKNKLAKLHVIGDVNKQSNGALADMKVRGWLAKKNDRLPREYILRLGNQEFEGTANIYRADLADANINNGCHAFEVTIPLRFADGNEYTATLFDKETALPVAHNKYKWASIKRPYTNFKEYLAWSYCGQYVAAPFVEEDKRAFSIMELIANNLSNLTQTHSERTLISIIMPTYNRANLIKNSIVSVLNQVYQNWELLIIDDASTDNTQEVVRSIKDPRIKYFSLIENSGVSEARNKALDLAKGDYIAYLDSDNDWDSRFLSTMIGAIKHKLEHPDALYCGQIVYTGKQKELSGIRFGMYNKSLLLNNNYIDMNCFIHKRILNNQTPKFDTSLKRFVDWDFIVKVSQSHNIYSIPVLLSNYYLDIADNSITSNAKLSGYLQVVRDKINQTKLIRDNGVNQKSKLRNGISIIIPSFNAKPEIAHCIESIIPHLNKHGKNIELIIVDNNSSPDTINLLEEYQKANPVQIKLIKLKRNFGFTYAVNKGIESARKGYDVLLLNNDATLTQNCLIELQNPLYDHSEYGLSVPAQILPGGTETITTHVPYALPEFDTDVNISVHHRNLTNPPTFYGGEYLEIDFAPFFCVLIKSTTLKNIPFLDAINGRHYRSDRTYCEFAQTLFNTKIAYCPNSIVYHSLQKSTAELKKSKTQEDPAFKRIFIQNTWSTEELLEIGGELPKWNLTF